MSIGSILRSAFDPSIQQLRYILLDILWRFVWSVVSFAILLMAGSAAMAQWAALLAQGPELTQNNPIIVLATLQRFWERYGPLVLTTAGLVLLTLLFLWIVLESLFRGGWRGFWTYLATGVARATVLLGLLGIFVVLSSRDETRGTLLVGAVVMTGMWFLVGMMESVTRRNAVELLATDLPRLSAVMGLFRGLEAALIFVLLGSAAAAWMRTYDKALGATWFVVVVLFWMLIHSYLVAVRYAAIDIMRRNGVSS